MDNGGRTELTHQELVEHLKGVVMTAMEKGGKEIEAASDDLALATGSPVIQDGGGISTEWHERDGDY